MLAELGDYLALMSPRCSLKAGSFVNTTLLQELMDEESWGYKTLHSSREDQTDGDSRTSRRSLPLGGSTADCFPPGFK